MKNDRVIQTRFKAEVKDKLCDVCGKEPAKYKNKRGRAFCRDCLVGEYGLCAICANDCKDDLMTVDACSNFEEK